MVQIEVQNLNVQSTQHKLDHDEEMKLQEKKFDAKKKIHTNEKN